MDDGTLVGSTKYYPYGNCRNSTGDLGTDKLFTGQRLDDTGLYYYGARYYDPTIGRFISPDSIVPSIMNPQSLNRYSYALNNPLRYNDPTGQWPNWGSIISSVTSVITSVTSTVTSAWNTVSSYTSSWYSSAYSYASSAWSSISNTASTALTTVTQAVQQAKTSATSAAYGAAGVKSIGTIMPEDVAALPPPVQITEPITIVEMKQGSLPGGALGMSIYPVAILVEEGQVKSSDDLVSSSTAREELHHWYTASQEGGSNVLTSPWNQRWLGEQLKGLVTYGDWYTSYLNNPVEFEGGVYSGRLDVNQAPSAPWWENLFK